MKKFLSVILAAVITLSLASCGFEENFNVDVSKKSVKIETTTYLNEQEYAMLGEENAAYKEVTKNDKTYYAATETQTFSSKELGANGIVLDNNKFIAYTGKSESAFDPNQVEFLEVKFIFNKDVVKTNGKLQADKRTVVFDNIANLSTSVYAFFNKEAVASKKIKASVTGKYTNKNTVKFTADSFISSFVVNGKKITPTANVSNEKLLKDYYSFTKQGKFKIKVNLINGSSKTFSFIYDKTAPTTNLKNNKKYKSGTKFSVKDKYGVKTIKLDNKKTKNNQKIKKTGKHTLTMWDNAGNKSVVKFTIKK